MLHRFKVTKTPDANGEIEVTINPTKDLMISRCYVTLPAYTSNVIRDATIRRKDGSLLGIEKAVYCTSQKIGLLFEGGFLLPHYDPALVVDTGSVIVAAVGDITLDLLYEEVELER